MNEITFASILNNVVAHGDGYLCLVLIGWVAWRQFQFEHYCRGQFERIGRRLDAIESVIATIQIQLKIHEFKHEQYEERLKRLEDQRAERARIQ